MPIIAEDLEAPMAAAPMENNSPPMAAAQTGQKNNSPPPQAAQAPPGAAQAISPSPGAPPGAQGQGGAQAAPERQTQYDLMVVNSLEYIHGKQLQPIVERLKQSAQKAPEVAGGMAGDILIGQALSARGAGVELDRGAMFHAAKEVVGDLIEVAEAAGALQAPAQQAVNIAFMAAVDRMATSGQAAGLFSEQELAGAQQYLSGLKAKAPAQPGAQPPAQGIIPPGAQNAPAASTGGLMP